VSSAIRAIDKAARAEPPQTPAGRAQLVAVQAIKASLEAAQPQVSDARARALARAHPEADLRKIAAFLESPAGRPDIAPLVVGADFDGRAG
jgi:hypothetical protein